MSDSKGPSPIGPAPHDLTQPILTHEKSLLSKIARGSEAGDILDQQLVMLGIQLVTQLNVLIKTSRIHGRTNAALDHPVNAMLTLIKTIAIDHPAVLRVQNDFLFLGDSHLKMSSQQLAVFASIIDALNKWKIGGISFSSAVESKDLREFAAQFVSMDPDKHTVAELQEVLTANGVNGIELEEPRVLELRHLTEGPMSDARSFQGAGLGGDHSKGTSHGGKGVGGGDGVGPGVATEAGTSTKSQRKSLAKTGYARAATAIGDLTQNVRTGGTISFKQAKRAIQNIVELMMQDEATLLGLTTLRCHDQYTHNHSVNVSLLSIALGNRAGYPKVELADLGLAALFHDMGKSSIPLEVLNKPGEFSDEDWAAMRSHPTQGVLELTKLRGITNLPGRMAAASFEHHMNCDHSGYPKLSVPWNISLTGRILMIADCYDAMTSSRVYRREPISPSRVLQMMFAKSKITFDPVLMKLFVNCVGILPIGSLVVLDTNELAVVLKPAEDKANAERPLVKVITDAQGNPIDDGLEHDLTETNEMGAYTRSIVRCVDNTEYRFDTSRYFV